jgi:hypothetical protein
MSIDMGTGAWSDAGSATELPERVATEVMLCLDSEDGADWPPYPAETVAADLIGPGLAELTASPWFAVGVSSGDVVEVRHDGTGWVAGRVICRGGHTTIQMIAATNSELAPTIETLRTFGALVREVSTPSMITIDVSEGVPLRPILDLLNDAESMTCAYTVACAQHRVDG